VRANAPAHQHERGERHDRATVCRHAGQRQKSVFITVLWSAFNQEADEAWRRAPSSSRSIEGLY
jgi:hypothetical protein